MKGFRLTSFFCLAWIFSTTPQAAEPAPGAPAIERRDWVGKIKAAGRVQVDNPWGDVRIRFGGYERKVEYHAVLQPLTPGAARLMVAAESVPDGLRVVVRVENGALPGGARDRADLTVFVPKGSPVSVRTVRGAIEIRGVKGDVSAESESGEISIRGVDGLVKTSNQYGATTVMLERAAPQTEQTFESLTGDITVSLPAAAEPKVTIATSGEISTDVSLVISRHPSEEPNKIASAVVGAGAAALLIRSKRGNIHLRQREDLRARPAAAERPADDSDD